MWSCLLLLSLAISVPFEPQKTMILLANHSILDTHSAFINMIKSHSHQVDFMLGSEYANLIKDGKITHNNIIVLSPSFEAFNPKLKQFFEANSSNNIMMFADYVNNYNFRFIARELGVDISPPNTMLAGTPYISDPYVFTSQNLIDAPVIATPAPSGIAFQGTGLKLDESNPYVFSILSASDNTCNNLMKEVNSIKDIIECGSQITLVAGYQSLYNNRAVISGSLQMCSNQFMLPEIFPTSNYKFCKELVDWVFKESGNVQIQNIEHRKPGQEKFPDVYKINEETAYSFDFLEWDKESGAWKAYDDNSIQMEFVMLYPYVRENMQHIGGNSTYFTKFSIPNKIGVFKYKVGFRRIGYMNLNVSTQVSVRPYGINELDRFYPSAYPYYGSIFVVMLGFVIILIGILSTK
jgi:oligosaccharyltransferase complex subunit beta